MKKVLIGAFALGTALSGNAAFAGPLDDINARLDALERENAAIRKENVALRENRSLREQNNQLRSSLPARVAAPAPAATAPAPAAGIAPAPVAETKPSRFGGLFDALAADLPTYKAAAPVVATPGRARLWVEGGAIWTGGDPVTRDFLLTDFTTSLNFLGVGSGGGGLSPIPGQFDLTPKIGWSAATGFDYRFANSLWHVNGAFRYNQGGSTKGTAQSSGNLDLSIFGGGVPPGVTFAANGTQIVTSDYREAHWLADIGAGYELAGSGPAYLQFKGGLRVAEFVARTVATNAIVTSATIDPPLILVGPPDLVIGSVSSTNKNLAETRASFLGAGPRIGIEGSFPLVAGWVFDYEGDAAVLFGTQSSRTTTTIRQTLLPVALALQQGGLNNSINTTVAERFATVFSADIQAGIGYWVTPNLKVSASYRLDALINVQNQENPAVGNFTPDRYTHGPRLAVTGQF